MRTFSMLLALILLGGGGLCLSTAAQAKAAESESNYRAYAEVLAKYVDESGMVQYAELKKNRSELDDFLKSTEKIPSEVYKKWKEEEKIAFWINIYNGRTLEVIIDNYPIPPHSGKHHRMHSIRQIPGAWDKISFEAAGQKLTLDEVEHKILRAKFHEPRIHMALVCAAHSCPPLRKEPYTGQELKRQLADQSRKFLSRQANFSIDNDRGIVYLSSIFKWFKDDFKKVYKVEEKFKSYGTTDGVLLSFVNMHSDEKTQALLASRKWKIKYVDYNWQLNDND